MVQTEVRGTIRRRHAVIEQPDDAQVLVAPRAFGARWLADRQREVEQEARQMDVRDCSGRQFCVRLVVVAVMVVVVSRVVVMVMMVRNIVIVWNVTVGVRVPVAGRHQAAPEDGGRQQQTSGYSQFFPHSRRALPPDG